MTERVEDTATRPAVDPDGKPDAASSTPAGKADPSKAPAAPPSAPAPAGPPAPAPPTVTPATPVNPTAQVKATPVTKTAKAAGRSPRRARLRLTRLDPWSVMKTSFLLSIAFAVVTVVSVAMVWQVLGAAGVWDSINSTIQEGIGGEDVASFRIEDYLGTSRVLGFTMLVAAIDVVLITAAATLLAFLYNMSAALLGGIEITLAEDN